MFPDPRAVFVVDARPRHRILTANLNRPNSRTNDCANLSHTLKKRILAVIVPHIQITVVGRAPKYRQHNSSPIAHVEH
jgi:hypothetical protein